MIPHLDDDDWSDDDLDLDPDREELRQDDERNQCLTAAERNPSMLNR